MNESQTLRAKRLNTTCVAMWTKVVGSDIFKSEGGLRYFDQPSKMVAQLITPLYRYDGLNVHCPAASL